jgi:hypothetical protein
LQKRGLKQASSFFIKNNLQKKLICWYKVEFAIDAPAGSKVVPVPLADFPSQPSFVLTGTPFFSAYVTSADFCQARVCLCSG